MCSSLKESLKHEKRLVLHSDGTLLPALRGKQKVDLLPVVVSGADDYQLLGVPQLQSETGIAQAIAVADLVKQWNLDNIPEVILQEMCKHCMGETVGLETSMFKYLSAALEKLYHSKYEAGMVDCV